MITEVCEGRSKHTQRPAPLFLRTEIAGPLRFYKGAKMNVLAKLPGESEYKLCLTSLHLEDFPGWLFAAHLIALLTGLRQWLLCLASEHTEDSPMLARLGQVLLHGGVVKLQEEGSENFTIRIFVDPEPVEEAKLDRPHAPILERHGCEQG